MVKFEVPFFRLAEDGNKILPDEVDRKPTDAELEEVSASLALYVEETLKQVLGFEVVPLSIVPDYIPPPTDTPLDAVEPEAQEDWRNIDTATTSILASPGWTTSKKILIIMHNASGSNIGIWSRSLCLEQGLNAGTMLPYIERALAAEYAVLVLRPNTNSVFVEKPSVADGEKASNIDQTVSSQHKVLIKGSESPESHVISVWENILPQAIGCDHIALLGYGNGASLCHSLYLKSILSQDMNIIHSFVTIEASNIVQEDDSVDVRVKLENLAINFEHSLQFPIGTELNYRKPKLGVSSLSLGMPAESVKSLDYNVAISASLALDGVFTYLQLAYDYFHGDNDDVESSSTKAVKPPATEAAGAKSPSSPSPHENTVVDQFKQYFSVQCSLTGDARFAHDAPMTASSVKIRKVDFHVADDTDHTEEAVTEKKSVKAARIKKKKRPSIFNFFFGKKGEESDAQDSSSPASEEPNWDGKFRNEMCVEDFDLLKVVGKGAFGKVLLVRKKEGAFEGNYYAMKILRKTTVIAGSQVEHTLAERAILLEVKQPYIVHLRFAFQNRDKLYLLTDYYNGGTLFMHLCNEKQFSEERVVFYGAEILSAIAYLHDKNIIYRDLKLENIMMDHNGHLALIDFGLSKHHFDETGATTFCGTAYYIAPEVLKGFKYGYAVDYWSFGVLLYEMMRGRTPFQDVNKKMTFMRIMKAKPTYNPDFFTNEATELVSGLLTLNPEMRLGSDPELGALEVMRSPFFRTIDWGKLSRKEITPPFVPDLTGPSDTKYVGKTYERMDPTRESRINSDVVSKANKNSKGLDSVVFPSFTYTGSSLGSVPHRV